MAKLTTEHKDYIFPLLFDGFYVANSTQSLKTILVEMLWLCFLICLTLC
jgi:hypothetical protein